MSEDHAFDVSLHFELLFQLCDTRCYSKAEATLLYQLGENVFKQMLQYNQGIPTASNNLAPFVFQSHLLMSTYAEASWWFCSCTPKSASLISPMPA